MDQKAATATGSLESLSKRIEGLEQRTTSLSEIEKRVQTLLDATARAQQQAERLVAPDGDLEKHRRQLEQVSTQASEAQSTVEALKRERVALEEFGAQLRDSQTELRDIRQSVDQAMTLRAGVEQVRGVADQLSQEYAKLRDTSREAREDSQIASEAVKDVERKLGRLAQLQELSKATEEKLTALNALAEHVNQKARALDAQKHVMDRAVVEANRLNEMVWNMDAQIASLNDGLKHAGLSEATLERIEQIVTQTTAKLDDATTLRDEFVRETARLEKEGRALVDAMRSSVEQLTLDKKEVETLHQRLGALEGSLQQAEGRMEVLGSRERQLAHLPQRIVEFSAMFQHLLEQAEDLGTKQTSLETLRDQLAQVQDMSARATTQQEALRQSRADLEILRKEMQDFHRGGLARWWLVVGGRRSRRWAGFSF